MVKDGEVYSPSDLDAFDPESGDFGDVALFVVEKQHPFEIDTGVLLEVGKVFQFGGGEDFLVVNPMAEFEQFEKIPGPSRLLRARSHCDFASQGFDLFEDGRDIGVETHIATGRVADSTIVVLAKWRGRAIDPQAPTIPKGEIEVENNQGWL